MRSWCDNSRKRTIAINRALTLLAHPCRLPLLLRLWHGTTTIPTLPTGQPSWTTTAMIAAPNPRCRVSSRQTKPQFVTNLCIFLFCRFYSHGIQWRHDQDGPCSIHYYLQRLPPSSDLNLSFLFLTTTFTVPILSHFPRGFLCQKPCHVMLCSVHLCTYALIAPHIVFNLAPLSSSFFLCVWITSFMFFISIATPTPSFSLCVSSIIRELVLGFSSLLSLQYCVIYKAYRDKKKNGQNKEAVVIGQLPFQETRRCFQRGPHSQRITSRPLESIKRILSMVNIHPTPTPWIPGSIATVAAALCRKVIRLNETKGEREPFLPQQTPDKFIGCRDGCALAWK